MTFDYDSLKAVIFLGVVQYFLSITNFLSAYSISFSFLFYTLPFKFLSEDLLALKSFLFVMFFLQHFLLMKKVGL